MTCKDIFGLCKYKDIFGKPGQGIHSIRLFDIAVIDVIMTIVAGYYLHKYNLFNNLFGREFSQYEIIILLFVLGIVFHKIFCVETKINSLIF